MRPDRQITLEDVAAKACVSPKTVSRVMNHEPNVRAATRARVIEAARDLGYRPNPAARSLAASRSFLIGHLYDNPNYDYIFRANAGIYDAGRRHGYFLLPEPFDSGAPDLVGRVEEFLLTSGVDSVILTPPLASHEALLRHLDETDTPFVLISPGEERQRQAAFIRMDQRAAAREMTEHLIALGHRRLAFVSPPQTHKAAAQRQLGFYDALEAAGIDRADCLIENSEFTLRGGMQAAEKLLSHPLRPTGVFAASDHIAAGVVTAAYRRGLSVPRDLSVAGFDASELGEAMWPPLTTIRNPIREMTRKAADYLMKTSRDARLPMRDTVACELVIRGSTGPAPDTI